MPLLTTRAGASAGALGFGAASAQSMTLLATFAPLSTTAQYDLNVDSSKYKTIFISGMLRNGGASYDDLRIQLYNGASVTYMNHERIRAYNSIALTNDGTDSSMATVVGGSIYPVNFWGSICLFDNSSAKKPYGFCSADESTGNSGTNTRKWTNASYASNSTTQIQLRWSGSGSFAVGTEVSFYGVTQ